MVISTAERIELLAAFTLITFFIGIIAIGVGGKALDNSNNNKDAIENTSSSLSINLCEGVICPDDVCSDYECEPSTGTCFLANYTIGCCILDSQCLNIPVSPCAETFCNTTRNQCDLKTSRGGECIGDVACNGGFTCDLITCTCVDQCEGVECPSDQCSIRRCNQFSGLCEQSGRIPNCCTNSTECFVPNQCQVGDCVNNRCQPILGPNSTCAVDGDCDPQNGSFCVGCRCTDPVIVTPMNITCTSNSDCPQSGNCTLSTCTPSGCSPIPLMNCCTDDSDCDDSNPCTEDTCFIPTGQCRFDPIDQDGDGIVCQLDCDDLDDTTLLPRTWYRDCDDDGRGDFRVPVQSCTQPMGFVSNFLDCNDILAQNNFEGAHYCDSNNYQVQVLTDQIQDLNNGVGFLECGIAVDVFGNLSARVCGDFRDFTNTVGSFRGGKLQMAEFDEELRLWIDTDSFNILEQVLSLPARPPEPFSVSIYETTIVVGEIGTRNDIGRRRSGYAYILSYDFSTRSLTLLQELGPSTIDEINIANNIRFGYSVSIWEDIIVIGVPELNVATGNDNGAVVILRNNGTYWNVEQVIEESRGLNTARQFFGRAVKVRNGFILVGAPTRFEFYSYVEKYIFDGSTWVVDWVYPSAMGSPLINGVGQALDMDDNRIAVGGFTDSQIDLARATVLDFDGNLIQELIRPQPSGPLLNGFANSIAIEGDMLAVGCLVCDGTIENSGAIYIYFISQEFGDFYYLANTIFPFDTPDLFGSEFGTSVRLQNGTIFTGAPFRVASNNRRFGAKYVYSCDVMTQTCTHLL